MGVCGIFFFLSSIALSLKQMVISKYQAEFTKKKKKHNSCLLFFLSFSQKLYSVIPSLVSQISVKESRLRDSGWPQVAKLVSGRARTDRGHSSDLSCRSLSALLQTRGIHGTLFWATLLFMLL